MINLEHHGHFVVSTTDPGEDRGDHETLSRLLSAASAVFDTDRAAAKACIEQAAELLIRPNGECNAATNKTASRGGLAPWQRKRVTQYIEANIGSNIRVEDIARVTRLSLGHFFRVFRESFGESPLAYVARRRVLRSQALMRNSRASLAEIALQCGMCDQAHFTRVFHRIVGMNPGDWRRHSTATVLTGDSDRVVEG